MKKGIEWLKETIQKEMDKDPISFERKLSYGFVIGLIDQLDEPPVMKSLTKEEHNALHTYENGAITKPTHYLDKHGKDLYQKWYEEHDFETFRHIMRSIAERYTSRYENKNGFEDLDKGIYTLQRLRKYEEMENEGN